MNWECNQCFEVNADDRTWCQDCGEDHNVVLPTLARGTPQSENVMTSNYASLEERVVAHYLNPENFNVVLEKSKTLDIVEVGIPKEEDSKKPINFKSGVGWKSSGKHLGRSTKVDSKMTMEARYRHIANVINNFKGTFTNRQVQNEYLLDPSSSDAVSTGMILSLLAVQGFLRKESLTPYHIIFEKLKEIPQT